jgi:ketosteroid isomerase-like protein
MSEANVDLVHRAFAAFNRRDLDAFLALVDRDVEFAARFIEMEGSSHYQGHAGIRDWWQSLLAIFPDFTIDPLEVRVLDDTVITAVRVSGHGADSGVPIDQVVWQVSKVCDGKAIWWRNFATEAEALEAAGLHE